MASSSPIVFRARGLTADGGDDQKLGSALSTAILSRLSDHEKSHIDFSVAITSSCYGSGKKVGLVTFRGGVPSFLSAAFENPLRETQMEVGEADITFDCNFFDFTQLYDPEFPVLADVVAITGLDGHAYGSWRGKGELSRMWLRDFLSKDLPRCRVLTYGYNSKLTGKSRGLERILDYGRGFLEEIKLVRSTDEEMRRPLIFIAHSFGGLVLAQSLVQAVLSVDRANKLVYDATYAILFFGTPHRGLSVDDIRGLLSDQDHPRHGLLDQIKSNSDSLVDQLGNFKNIIHDRKIVSFYEAEQTPQLANDGTAGRWQRTGSFATAVGMDSALLNLPDHMEEKIPLSSNHSMMVKFDSRDSKGYQIAISRLRKFEKDAGATVAARLGSDMPPRLLRTHTEMKRTMSNSVESVDSEMTMQPSSCCGTRPEASFTQDDLDSLSSEAYRLFTLLKRKASSTDRSLGEIEQPVYSFKCALTHLTNNLGLVLSGPEPPEKLHAMMTVFARTLKELHKVAEHASKELDISKIRTDLESHSTNVQKLLDDVLVNHSKRKFSTINREAQGASGTMHPQKRVKRQIATFSTEPHYKPPETHPQPTIRAFAMSESSFGSSLMAMPRVLSATRGPASTCPAPPSAMEASDDIAMCSADNGEAAPTKELSEGLAEVNIRRRIASAGTRERLSRLTGTRSGRHIPVDALGATTGRRNGTDPVSPFDWTERLSTALPLRPADARQRSREFSGWLRRLNNHMSGLPKHARLSFRRDLEENGRFLGIIEQARNEYGESAFVRKEIQVYQDDKEDDI